MNTYQLITVAAASGISIFLLFVGIASVLQRKHESLQRLENYVSPDEASDPAAASANGLLAMLDRWIAKRGFGAGIARSLARADLKLTVSEYLLLHLALLAGGLLLGPIIFHQAAGGILVGLPLLMMPKVYVSAQQRKRQQAFAEQLPSALNSLGNSLRSGYGLVQAMKLVSTEMSPPLATEFQRVVSEVGYGLPYDTAFRNMLRRNESTDLSMVVTAIEINLEVGGNLAEILDSISSIIRDRVRLHAQVASLTAMTRFSSLVLTCLPFGLALLIFIVNPSYISQLWTTSGGLAMLGLAVGMVLMGSLLLSRLGRIDV